MTLQLPPELLEVYELAGGGHWPQGDEDALRALAESHSAYGGAVASHHGDAVGSLDQAIGSVEGKLHDSLSGIRGELDHELREVSQAHGTAAAALQQAANAVEHTKAMMLSCLAVLKSEIATARAMEAFTCGAARAAEAAAIASAKLAIATLAGTLTGELGAAGAVGAATTIRSVSVQSLLPQETSARATAGADEKANNTEQSAAPAGNSTAQTASLGDRQAPPPASPSSDPAASADTAAPAPVQGRPAPDARAATAPPGPSSASTGPGGVAQAGNTTPAARSMVRTTTAEKASREAAAARGAQGATISADPDALQSGFEQAAPNARLADLAPMADDSALAEQAGRYGPGTMGQNLSELVQQGQQGAQQITQTVQQAVQQASQQNSMQAAQSMMSEAGDTERFSLGQGAESSAKAPHGGLSAGGAPQGAGAGAGHSLSAAPPSGSGAHPEAAAGRAGGGAVPTALRPSISQSGGGAMGAMGAGGAYQGQQQRSVPVPEYLRGSFDSEAPPIAVVDSVIGDLSANERDEAEDLHTLAQQRASFGDEVQLDSAEWASEH